MNTITVTVADAIRRNLNDFDDPLMLYGTGCVDGKAHIVGELFHHNDGRGDDCNVMRCCACGLEMHPADDFVLTIQHWYDDELEPMDA